MPDLSKTAARIIAAVAVVALIALLLFLHSCQQERTAKMEAKLATGQAGAAVASGSDAANTIGNRMGADAQTDTITRENDDAIHNAVGADTPVPPAVGRAGLGSLCRRAAYIRDPRCVQHAHP